MKMDERMYLEKDELLFKKRLLEQARLADIRGICIFSDFMNLNEQTIYHNLHKELPKIKYFTNGGYSEAERKILCFCGNHSIQEENLVYPVSCLKIAPLNHKFSDKLTHRDYLGAVLNLGLERSKIGDIIIINNEGYLFAHNTISGYIAEQLYKVKHTSVSVQLMENSEFEYQPDYKEITGTVSSVRLDRILAVAFHSSRSSLSGLIEGGRVSVGGKLILSNSYPPKENDIISVRGYGKFIYKGTSYQTKKGRYSVKILLLQ